jgi:hypothetical protein
MSRPRAYLAPLPAEWVGTAPAGAEHVWALRFRATGPCLGGWSGRVSAAEDSLHRAEVARWRRVRAVRS